MDGTQATTTPMLHRSRKSRSARDESPSVPSRSCILPRMRKPRLFTKAQVLAMFLLCAALVWAADGKRVFNERCAGCHGSDARGSGKGPGLAGSPRLSGMSAEQLRGMVQRGFPDSGMPAFDLPPEELDAVAIYVRGLNAGVTAKPAAGKQVTWGKPEPGDWLTYNGKLSANRYSELKQINTGECRRAAPEVDLSDSLLGLEVTPLEAGGVMYVTGPNQVYAIDALTGNQIWKYSRPQTRGLEGDAALGTNRGVAIRDEQGVLRDGQRAPAGARPRDGRTGLGENDA